MSDDKKTSSINWYTVNRLAAWVLFITILTYGLTGYGMTKGLIPSSLARSLHFSWLGIIGLVALVTHTSISIRLSMIRRSAWNLAAKIRLVVFYLIITSLFLWLHFFYQSDSKTNHQAINLATASTATTTVFTAQTLAIYNGLNGQPAYVAVDGIVYDMSKDFQGGQHHGYRAGQDLSAAFHDQHPAGFLTDLTIVGAYQR